MKLISAIVIMDGSSSRIISILIIGFITMTILWVLLFLKTRKLKARIKELEGK